MSATQPAAPKARPYDNPRYGRNARTAIAKWFMQVFPIEGVTESLLVARRDDQAIHDLYTQIKSTLRLLETVQLVVLDSKKDMNRSEKIAKEAEIRAPQATFDDEMKAAHRQDFDARQARRAEQQSNAGQTEERAAG